MTTQPPVTSRHGPKIAVRACVTQDLSEAPHQVEDVHGRLTVYQGSLDCFLSDGFRRCVLTHSLRWAIFQQGSVEVAFLGGPEALQGWVILKRGGQVMETPLATVGQIPARSFISFWGGTRKENENPSFFLSNGGLTPVGYRTIWAQEGRRHQASGIIEPGATAVVSVDAPGNSGSGWFEVEHDGEPGQVVGVAMLSGQATLVRLPWEPGDREPELSIYHTVGVPGYETSPHPAAQGEATVTLFNPGQSEQSVAVEVRALDTGKVLANQRSHLAAWEVREVNLSGLLNRTSTRGTGPRLTIRPTGPLLVSGSYRHHSGETEDISFFRATDAHASGSYPIPSPTGYDVRTTVVNLGTESVRIVAQLYWSGQNESTYALGPFQLAGGAGLSLEIDEILRSATPDLLGRLPEPGLQDGYLKWLSQQGQPALIARAEVRPRQGRDHFGFSCFGCCEQFPTGVVVPGSMSFEAGQSVPLDACVQYSTCNGIMGPYTTDPTSITAPTPFSWDGITLSATVADAGTVSFQGDEVRIHFSCAVSSQQIGASASVDACKAYLKKSHQPLAFWDATKAACTQELGDVDPGSRCQACNECCDDKRNFWLCKKKNRLQVDSDHRTCMAGCLTDHC